MSYNCLTSKPNISKQELSEGKGCNKKTAWLTGFLTNLSNPKAIVFFLSILPLFLQNNQGISYQCTVVLIIIFTTFIWFSFITTIIGHKIIRDLFIQYSHWLEKSFGIILILFSCLLLFSVLFPNTIHI